MAAPDPIRDAEVTADVVEGLGASVSAEYRALEVRMIGIVADELAAGNIADPATEARLRAEGRRLAAGIPTAQIAAEVVAIAGAAGAAVAVTRSERAGGRRIEGGRVVRQSTLTVELTADLDKMTPRIARWMGDVYVSASSLFSIDDARNAMASRLLSKGITGKVYRNGARMPIGSYAEMVTRTISNQAAIGGGISSMQQSGINLCQIIIGSDACETCAANRGKVFSLDGTPAGVYQLPSLIGGAKVSVTIAGPLFVASSKGSHFRGPNCRCQVVQYQVGLAPIPGSTTWTPEAEAARDRQRAIERGIREWKAREAAALDDMQKAEARRKVRTWQGKMRDHLAETGRVRTPYREQLAFSAGRTMPAPLPRPALITP